MVPATGGAFETGAGYLLTDAVGTPTYTTDSAGQATGVTTGGVFGTSSASSLVTGFAGGVNTADGLVQFGVRDYDPAQGRFTTADSWTVGGSGTGGYNRYAYAGNNPVTYTDPTGHSVVEFAVMIARGPLVGSGEIAASGVLFSAVFGAAAGGIAYAIFGPEPKTAQGALTWMVIGGIDGICGAVAKNALVCGALNGVLFQAASDIFDTHSFSGWSAYAQAASINGVLAVGAGWAGYGMSKLTAPAWNWIKQLAGRAWTSAKSLAGRSASWFAQRLGGGLRVGIDRGDGRDILGHFTGKGGYGASQEAQGLVEYTLATGRSVDGTKVRATLPDGSTRYYDGLALKADGTYEGVEVKGGTGSLGEKQRRFDGQVDAGTVATARLNGMSIRITSTYLVRVE